jgi:stress response protein SCP2
MPKKIILFLALAVSLASLAAGAGAANAASAATLSLTTVSGDNVRVNVTGEPSRTVRLSFLPSGGIAVTTLILGSTDINGNFVTSISSGGYGIPQGSPAYVTIEGMQSATTLWPSYSSSLTLSQTNVTIAEGQNITIAGSHSLILVSNSMSSVIGAALSGSQITITGLQTGSGVLRLCGANAGCVSLSVTVGSEGESQVSFSQNNVIVRGNERKDIDIYGGAENGYAVISNSNPSAVDASVRGGGNLVVIYAGTTTGAATVVVCSRDVTTNCANLYVTSLDSEAGTLSFSQDDIILNPGVTRNITVSGGTSNNYYISSNSNSGAVTASISGDVMTLTGGGNAGSSVIKVCSTTVNATCGELDVTLNINDETASDTSLSFSQNVVTVAKKDTTNVTVNGGGDMGYVLSANTDPSSATATIASGSNIISIYGVEVGSSIITVCSVSGGSVCASIYVSVSEEMVPIYFSQNDVSLTAGSKLIITVSGGSGTDKVISANSNPSAVSATLQGNGSVLVLSGGTVAGTTSITVCSATYSNNCATLSATLNADASNPSPSSSSNSTSGNSSSAAQDLIGKIMTEASNVINASGLTRNVTLETQARTAYTNRLTTGASMSDAAQQLITDFVAYGTPTTEILGAGERAGVVSSYQTAFGKLPSTESEWADVIKIANGRWPGQTSSAAIESGKVEFRKVYKREANLDNPNDNAAVSIIAYGLRPTARNLASEKAAIKTFRSVYGHDPASALAWDIVRAIAYSGAKR